jgi:hypothetical protein
MSNGRKVKVQLATGGTVEGTEIQVNESSERWSDFTLADGTVLRAKLAITSAVRVDGQYDPQGNPMYTLNMAPIITVLSVPEELRRKVN